MKRHEESLQSGGLAAINICAFKEAHGRTEMAKNYFRQLEGDQGAEDMEND